MAKRKTAGELSLKAKNDNSVYDPLELGYAMTDDVVTQATICALRHEKNFEEDEYFVVLQRASDPLISNIKRHKYAAFIHLPSPRPEQSCFLYNKKTQKLKRLWSLPDAMNMAKISEMPIAPKKWGETKRWCDAFFKLRFWEEIRKQHGISHLAEIEYLNLHREELIKAGCQEVKAPPTDAFDFSKVSAYKVIDTDITSG